MEPHVLALYGTSAPGVLCGVLFLQEQIKVGHYHHACVRERELVTLHISLSRARALSLSLRPSASLSPIGLTETF